MKTCKYCHTTIDTDKNYCPICFNRLDNLDENSTGLYSLRKTNETTVKNSRFLLKLFFFLTVCSITACVLVNILLTHEPYWFWLVIFGEAYIWILVKHTILSKSSVFSKVVLQVLAAIAIMIFAERLSFGKWLVPYVYPSVSLSVTIVLSLLLALSDKRGEYVFGFSILVVILGLVSLILVLFDLSDGFDILNIINVSCCALSFFGYLLFGFNAMKNDLSKRWHL